MKKRFYLSSLLVLGFIFSSVVVKAGLPGITQDPRDTTVCTGSTTRFIVADTSTATHTHTWEVSTDGGTTWSLVTANATYSGVVSDTLKVVAANALNGYKYKGIVTNVTGSDTSTAATLTVDTLYSVITGPSAVCIGSTIALSDATAGGTWISIHTDTATINVSTGVVTGVGAGKDTIMYIATNTCGTDTAKKAITVLAIPTAGVITGASAVCLSSSVSLSDGVSGGVWSSLNTTIATVNNSGSVTGVAQGSATIHYTTTNGSCSISATYSIEVDTASVLSPVTGPSATCIGGTIYLSDANVTGGTGVWSTSNGTATVSATGAVTGVSSGNDVISYVFSNACNSVTATTTVEVDAPLSHGVISGPATVCVGSAIALSETVSGGIWLSSATGIANVDPSGNVTGISAGSVTISYYLANACGASIATYAIIVSAPAAVINGSDSVGVGAAITLSDGIPGGVWSTGNAAVVSVNSTSGVVTGEGTGNTTITYTVHDVCGTSTATLTVYSGVTASAPIVGSDSVCAGTHITMSDPVAGGVWTISNGRASVSTVGQVTGVTSGLDTVYYTVTNGFGSSQVRHIIFVNHLPVLTLYGPNIIALGGNYFIYGYPAGGTFTSISSSGLGEILAVYPGTLTLDSVRSGLDSVTINVTVCSYVVTGNGTDVISYHKSNTCGTTDSTYHLSLVAAGVSTVNNQDAKLNVYPNPNNGEFTLSLSSAVTEDAVVTITNIVGQKVSELTVSTNKVAGITLDQPAGIYFLSATTSTGRYSTKITIAK